ncbi:hypothetical protein HPB51_015448 [Rhipicephalus microplus]|uniref:Uncharacterized protein n=1 Tax=Rhipicephalus microplus TaxID=6941 RepID=A0A9J6DV74_RHIMP|nr:hypothetical protein HPB51_015448 [Rhipicephalus microplus]
MFASKVPKQDYIVNKENYSDNLPVSVIIVVLSQPFEVRAYDEFVTRGNAALFRCHLPSFAKDVLAITAWLRDDGLLIHSTLAEGGACSSGTEPLRYSSPPSGTELRLQQSLLHCRADERAFGRSARGVVAPWCRVREKRECEKGRGVEEDARRESPFRPLHVRTSFAVSEREKQWNAANASGTRWTGCRDTDGPHAPLPASSARECGGSRNNAWNPKLAAKEEDRSGGGGE